MSETTNSKNVRDDEIDLLDLFKRMGRGLGNMFTTLGRWFLISLVFLLRNWLPLFVSMVLGVGASYLLKFTSASFYTSDMVLKTNTMTADEMISYINRLHTYCREGNQTALSEAISLKDDKVKNILDISANWIIDKGADGIPDRCGSAFGIVLGCDAAAGKSIPGAYVQNGPQRTPVRPRAGPGRKITASTRELWDRQDTPTEGNDC